MSSVLTINAGSSSIKFSMYDVKETPVRRLVGQIDGIGSSVRLKATDAAGVTLIDQSWASGEGPGNHKAALGIIIRWLDKVAPDARVEGVGHRVVHGGKIYAAPMILDDSVVAQLAKFNPLAPLHQPHNVAGIHAAREAFPGAPQVACFDTAFHRTQPFVAEAFALPRHYYDEGLRRYGFHGLSYEYISLRMAEIAPVEAAGRVVVAHLGNGASMSAVKGGHCVATTLGFSPLDGVPMGTRCGQIDPGVLLYLMDEKGMSAQQISDLLYKECGLKGLSELSNDMRVLEGSDDPKSKLAIDYFCYRVRREIGSLAGAMDGIDALVFTAGIGENGKKIRARILEGTQWLGIELDAEANDQRKTVISKPSSKVKVFVVPTDEELMIARHTIKLLGIGQRAHATA